MMSMEEAEEKLQAFRDRRRGDGLKGAPSPNQNAMDECRLYDFEYFWRDHYHWLKEQGYLLRPRYHPEWVASWKDKQKSWRFFEDAQTHKSGLYMDATRINDSAIVVMKRLNRSTEPDEAGIGRFFSSDSLASDPDNYCVPVHDALPVPDDENTTLIVMPRLWYWEDNLFETIGEAVEFFRQAFVGLRFMHRLHIAHNDVKSNNMMVDFSPLYDEPVHPACPTMRLDFSGRSKRPRSRTLRPVKYYHIDFGHACRYNPEDGDPQIPVGYGGDHSVPEFATQDSCNPFFVDVYRAGNMIRANFIEGIFLLASPKRGFEFIEPLLQDMCQDDPTKRPTMDQVVLQFDKIVGGLSSWKLRSRVADVREPYLVRVLRDSAHWTRQIGRIARRIPAVPTA